MPLGSDDECVIYDVDAVVRHLAARGVTVGRRTAMEIIAAAVEGPPPGQRDLIITVGGSDETEAVDVTASEIRRVAGGRM